MRLLNMQLLKVEEVAVGWRTTRATVYHRLRSGKLRGVKTGQQWRRAVGLSAAKGRLSRQLGVPLTRKGRRRKAGAAIGCAVVFLLPIVGLMPLLFR